MSYIETICHPRTVIFEHSREESTLHALLNAISGRQTCTEIEDFIKLREQTHLTDQEWIDRLQRKIAEIIPIRL